MGFASGSVSYRRYHVSGPHPKAVDQKMIDSLGKHAFGSGLKSAVDNLEVGWIAPTHLFDTDLQAEKVTVGPFVHLVMRMDRLSAPPAVVRSYRRIEEEAAREASGAERLSPEQRRQAKDAAQAQADKEARQGKFRRISACPLIFDPRRHAVYFGALGATAHDKLRLLFSSTFGATLVPLDSAEVACQVARDAGRGRSFEDAVPAHLIDAPAGAGSGSADAANRSFLGREFLSWLWHEVDTGDGMVPVASNGLSPLPAEVGVVIERVMQLDCDFQLSGRDIIYADAPAAASEARAAIRIGKQPTRMGLVLGADGEQYRLVLDAVGWQVGGLTLPASDEPDPRVRLEERLGQLVRCTAMLDGLFAGFLEARLGSYAAKLGQLRRWARNGGNGSAGAAVASSQQAPLRVVR